MFSSNSGHNYKPISIGEYSDDSDDGGAGEDFIQRQVRHQKMALRRQDEGLEMLSESASRLGSLSLGISEELGHQNR